MIENMRYARCVMCRFPKSCAFNGRSNVIYNRYTNDAGMQPIRDLRRRSVATRFPGLRVRMPPVSWMYVVNFVWCQVEVSATGRSLMRCVVSGCDLEISRVRRPRPRWGCWATHTHTHTHKRYANLKCTLMVFCWTACHTIMHGARLVTSVLSICTSLLHINTHGFIMCLMASEEF